LPVVFTCIIFGAKTYFISSFSSIKAFSSVRKSRNQAKKERED
jgi:hypothetical protein